MSYLVHIGFGKGNLHCVSAGIVSKLSFSFPNDASVQVAPEPLEILFGKLGWCEESRLWDAEADLWRVVQYARGSKKLSIPSGWRDLLPKKMEF